MIDDVEQDIIEAEITEMIVEMIDWIKSACTEGTAATNEDIIIINFMLTSDNNIMCTNKTGAPTVDSKQFRSSVDNETSKLQTIMYIKAQTLELPKFSGDIMKFCSFWEST